VIIQKVLDVFSVVPTSQIMQVCSWIDIDADIRSIDRSIRFGSRTRNGDGSG